MDEQQELFATLAQSLTDFRAAVEGESGTKVKSMGADEGVLPDIIRGTIEGLADVLAWLHRVSEDVEDWVISGDAALAFFEVGGDTVHALKDGIQLGSLSENDAIPEEAISSINSVLQSAAAVIDFVTKLANSVLPPVEDILAIQDQLTGLMGKRNASPTEPPGSLSQLMTQIGID